MMKWLRQHTKQIMVVVVLLAMISFVGGSALVSFMSPKGEDSPFVKMFGKEFAMSDLRQSQLEITILDRLGVNWRLGGPTMGVTHWYMIAHEAQAAGIEVSDEEIDAFLQSLENQGLTPVVLERIRRDGNFSEVDLMRTIGKFIAVQKDAQRVTMAAMPSEPEVAHYVRDTGDKMSVRFASFDATRFVDEDAPITEAELQAQFEKYKDVFPADSESGFGYKYEDRVKIQYVVADLAQIKLMIDVGFEEKKNYWKANKEKYKKTEYVLDESAQPPATTQPATTQPAEPPKKKAVERMKSFSEAQKDVESDIRMGKAKNKAGQAIGKVTSEMLQPWFTQTVDLKTGFKPIPQDAAKPEFMKGVSERVSREFDVPLEYGESPLLSRNELSRYDRIGMARTLGVGTESLTLADLAFQIPAFMDAREARSATHKLQLFQTPDAHLSVVSSVGAKYVVFRVVEAAPAAAPPALDEVRAQVERDVRLHKAYESIEPIAEELYAVSLRIGLADGLKQFDDLRKDLRIQGPDVAGPFARREDPMKVYAFMQQRPPSMELMPPNVRGVGRSAPFVDACFEMVRDGWDAPAPKVHESERIAAASTQQPLAEAPVVRVFALPKLHKWFVIEKLNTEFVNEAQFSDELKADAYGMLYGSRAGRLRGEWFSVENIEKRCGFQPIGDEDVPQSIEGFDAPERPMPPQF